MSAAALIFVAVISVHDGDTFRAKFDDGHTASIRVVGVDTPEINGKCKSERAGAIAARDRARALLRNGAVLSIVGTDRYGRTLAHVMLPDGRDLDDVLIGEKLGRAYWGGRRQSWCD